MTKDEEIRMINEKLDFYVMEASDEEFDTEEVRKLVKRLDELDPIAAFCGLSFLLVIKITSKLSNFILHQFGGLHKLWDAPDENRFSYFDRE